MSREYAPIAPGQARTRVRREEAPSRGRASRALADVTTRSAGARVGAGPVGTRPLLALAAVLLVAGALLLGAGAIHAGALGSGTRHASDSRHSIAPATRAIDPRLILVPRTLTQAATADGVRVELTAAPLLPGPNRFALRLAEHGRPLLRASAVLVARMIGMIMPPLTLPMREGRPGRYVALRPLAMFGRWQLTVQANRPGTAPLRHQFTVGVDLPTGLLAAPATRGAPQQ